MSIPNTCSNVTLARNGVASIQRCTECGCVSIHVGPVTLRLNTEGLAALSEAAGEASAELRKQRLGASRIVTGVA